MGILFMGNADFNLSTDLLLQEFFGKWLKIENIDIISGAESCPAADFFSEVIFGSDKTDIFYMAVKLVSCSVIESVIKKNFDEYIQKIIKRAAKIRCVFFSPHENKILFFEFYVRENKKKRGEWLSDCKFNSMWRNNNIKDWLDIKIEKGEPLLGGWDNFFCGTSSAQEESDIEYETAAVSDIEYLFFDKPDVIEYSEIIYPMLYKHKDILKYLLKLEKVIEKNKLELDKLYSENHDDLKNEARKKFLESAALGNPDYDLIPTREDLLQMIERQQEEVVEVSEKDAESECIADAEEISVHTEYACNAEEKISPEDKMTNLEILFFDSKGISIRLRERWQNLRKKSIFLQKKEEEMDSIPSAYFGENDNLVQTINDRLKKNMTELEGIFNAAPPGFKKWLRKDFVNYYNCNSSIDFNRVYKRTTVNEKLLEYRYYYYLECLNKKIDDEGLSVDKIFVTIDECLSVALSKSKGDLREKLKKIDRKYGNFVTLQQLKDNDITQIPAQAALCRIEKLRDYYSTLEEKVKQEGYNEIGDVQLSRKKIKPRIKEKKYCFTLIDYYEKNFLDYNAMQDILDNWDEYVVIPMSDFDDAVETFRKVLENFKETMEEKKQCETEKNALLYYFGEDNMENSRKNRSEAVYKNLDDLHLASIVSIFRRWPLYLFAYELRELISVKRLHSLFNTILSAKQYMMINPGKNCQENDVNCLWFCNVTERNIREIADFNKVINKEDLYGFLPFCDDKIIKYFLAYLQVEKKYLKCDGDNIYYSGEFEVSEKCKKYVEKQDIENKYTRSELAESLDIDNFRVGKWYNYGICPYKKDGASTIYCSMKKMEYLCEYLQQEETQFIDLCSCIINELNGEKKTYENVFDVLPEDWKEIFDNEPLYFVHVVKYILEQKAVDGLYVISYSNSYTFSTDSGSELMTNEGEVLEYVRKNPRIEKEKIKEKFKFSEDLLSVICQRLVSSGRMFRCAKSGYVVREYLAEHHQEWVKELLEWGQKELQEDGIYHIDYLKSKTDIIPGFFNVYETTSAIEAIGAKENRLFRGKMFNMCFCRKKESIEKFSMRKCLTEYFNKNSIDDDPARLAAALSERGIYFLPETLKVQYYHIFAVKNKK